MYTLQTKQRGDVQQSGILSLWPSKCVLAALTSSAITSRPKAKKRNKNEKSKPEPTSTAQMFECMYHLLFVHSCCQKYTTEQF